MNQYRRHKSELNPSDLLQLQSSQKTTVSSVGSSSSVNKMTLRSNSIFAYQEYDEFSSFMDNTNTQNSIQSPEEGNTNSLNQSQDSSSYSDSEETFEKIDKKVKYSKKMSDGNVFYNHKLKNYEEYLKKLPGYTRSPIAPSFYPQPGMNFNQGPPPQFLKRNSLAFAPGFNLNAFQQKSKFSTFFDPPQNINNNNFPNYPIQILNYVNGKNQTNEAKPIAEDKYILDNLTIFLKEQNKCRIVQEKLEEKKNDPNFIGKFFHNIESVLFEIINHQFGNYVIQKFFDIMINQKNKTLITSFFAKIQNELFKISVNSYGTRVFQKALEKLDESNYENFETEELNTIIHNLIEKHLFPLCFDKNGNHVFQKIIRLFPKTKNDFIYNQLNQSVIEICKLKQGATILQTALKYANESQKSSLLHTILDDISTLINDEYGNYIIQFILDLKEKEYNEIIFTYITKNTLSLSKKKFSSNVIDKSIIQDDELSIKLIKHMIDSKVIPEMIKDQYGNYVIQKALTVTSGSIFMSIIKQIQPVVQTLKQSNIGRKIYEHLMRKYSEYFKEVE